MEGVESEKIPFGKLLMDHVKERCVLFKSCWQVDIGKSMGVGFGIFDEEDGDDVCVPTVRFWLRICIFGKSA